VVRSCRGSVVNAFTVWAVSRFLSTWLHGHDARRRAAPPGWARRGAARRGGAARDPAPVAAAAPVRLRPDRDRRRGRWTLGYGRPAVSIPRPSSVAWTLVGAVYGARGMGRADAPLARTQQACALAGRGSADRHDHRPRRRTRHGRLSMDGHGGFSLSDFGVRRYSRVVFSVFSRTMARSA
jgi:hypothetical protein